MSDYACHSLKNDINTLLLVDPINNKRLQQVLTA